MQVLTLEGRSVRIDGVEKLADRRMTRKVYVGAAGWDAKLLRAGTTRVDGAGRRGTGFGPTRLSRRRRVHRRVYGHCVQELRLAWVRCERVAVGESHGIIWNLGSCDITVLVMIHRLTYDITV